MAAVHPLQIDCTEGLYAYAQAVDAQSVEGFQLWEGEVVGIGFKGEFDIGRPREVEPNGFEYVCEF